MKTRHPIAYGLMAALSVGVVGSGLLACGGQDEPAKTASNPDPNGTTPGTTTPGTSGAAAAQATPPTAQNAPSETTTSAGWADHASNVAANNATANGAGAASSTPPSSTPAAGDTTAQSAPALTSEQILQVARTANEGEIEQARIAQSKSKNEHVQAMAAMMIRDHKAAEKKGDAICAKDNLTRQPSPTSESLQTDADGFTRALKAEAGPSFDKDYVQAQVREHEAVLDVIDRKLMPSANNADVKAYLEDVRVAVASHLEHARKLAQEMNKQALK